MELDVSLVFIYLFPCLSRIYLLQQHYYLSLVHHNLGGVWFNVSAWQNASSEMRVWGNCSEQYFFSSPVSLFQLAFSLQLMLFNNLYLIKSFVFFPLSYPNKDQRQLCTI